MFCETCGAPIQTTQKFCSNCGRPLSAEPLAVASVSTGRVQQHVRALGVLWLIFSGLQLAGCVLLLAAGLIANRLRTNA